jgi:hypothetical protein
MINASSTQKRLSRIVAEPFIENGRTLVPLRFITEPLGAEVISNDKDRSIQLNFKF